MLMQKAPENQNPDVLALKYECIQNPESAVISLIRLCFRSMIPLIIPRSDSAVRAVFVPLLLEQKARKISISFPRARRTQPSVVLSSFSFTQSYKYMLRISPVSPSPSALPVQFVVYRFSNHFRVARFRGPHVEPLRNRSIGCMQC